MATSDVAGRRGGSPGEEETVEALCRAAGAPLRRVCLGPGCLLGSHCIVLLQHYLDCQLHCCPMKLWEPPGAAIGKLTKQRQKRVQKAKARLAQPGGVGLAGGGGGAAVRCEGCGGEFASRNALFKHLRAGGGCGCGSAVATSHSADGPPGERGARAAGCTGARDTPTAAAAGT